MFTLIYWVSQEDYFLAQNYAYMYIMCLHYVVGEKHQRHNEKYKHI